MDPVTRPEPKRVVRAPRGTRLNAKSWQTEAPLRLMMNNLDPDVAENPDELIVYGGIGKAARNWECFDRIVDALKNLDGDETLLVQSGKPVGIFKTHSKAPRVLIANSNLVPAWSNWETFNELDRLGLTMFGQMTAGSWIYIGSQGIVQGTYETFSAIGRHHFDGNPAGRLVFTSGLGGMGGRNLSPRRWQDSMQLWWSASRRKLISGCVPATSTARPNPCRKHYRKLNKRLQKADVCPLPC